MECFHAIFSYIFSRKFDHHTQLSGHFSIPDLSAPDLSLITQADDDPMAVTEARMLKMAEAIEGRVLALLERKLDEILAATRRAAPLDVTIEFGPRVAEAQQDAVLLPSLPVGQDS